MLWTSSKAMSHGAGGVGLEDMERSFSWDEALGLIPAMSAGGVVSIVHANQEINHA